MGHFRGLLIGIHIPEGYLQAQSIILFVQQLLALAILLCATGNYMKQFFQNLYLPDMSEYFSLNA